MERVELDIRYENSHFTILCKNSPTDAPASYVQYLHTHRLSELHGIISGQGILHTNNGQHLLKPGDCLLIGPFVPHYFSLDPGSTLVRLEAYIRADGSDPADLYSSIINRSDVRIWSLDDAAFSYFRQAVEELSACRAGYLEAASAYLTLLLTELLRQNNSYLSSSDQKESKSTLEFQIAAQIDVFFSENYNQPVTIDDLSEYLNVSSRQAQRLVYRYCGTTFRQKIIFIRMEFAKRYLEETKLPIAQISELIGYEYPSSFCKAFYKQLGLTPDSYRRQVHESIKA